jgi:hypothetical protein
MRRLVLAIAVVLAGCGDDGGGGDIPIDGLASAVVSKYCSIYVTCGLIDDNATCRAIFPDTDIDPDLIAAVKAGKIIYHSDKARECLNSIGGTCDQNSFFDTGDREACDQTFEGTVHAGGQCALDEECVSQNCDVPSCPDACCQGMCVGDAAPVRPHVGEACGQVAQGSCVDSFCDDTTMLCTAYLATGQVCMYDDQCATRNCNGTCMTLPGTGEACTGSCRDIGDTCSATSMTCVAVGLTNDPCMSNDDCSPIYRCTSNMTCQLGPRLGEPCGTQTLSCIDRSYCEPTTMQCTAPKADGAACTGDSQCASRNCDATTNTCTTPPICI